MATPPDVRRISVILFDGFELLDVFGPVELLNLVDAYTVEFASPTGGPVTSSQGVQVIAEKTYEDLTRDCDIVLIPGGSGTRPLVHNQEFLHWLKSVTNRAQLVLSVCTGSALLAVAGALEGYSATSNKCAFSWASSFGLDVNWKPRARWVHDRDRWTSSGVAAGMDMAAAFIAHEQGQETADAITHRIELNVLRDSDNDPFAQ